MILPIPPMICEPKVPTKPPGNTTLSDTVTITATRTHVTEFQLHRTMRDGSELLLCLSEDNLA